MVTNNERIFELGEISIKILCAAKGIDWVHLNSASTVFFIAAR